MSVFKKATKLQSRLRIAIISLSGGGKTYTALKIGTGLSSKVAVIDTERGSASKYSDLFSFDVLELESFEPEKYIDAIKIAEKEGYEVIIIDSLSHAWAGTGGLLERCDTIKARSSSQNSYMAWGQLTPVHTRLIDAMLQSKAHVIVTMRTKTEYVLEKNDQGKQVPKKIGTQPVQRDGMEYEFDFVGDMDSDHNLVVGKTRITGTDGKVFSKPGQELIDILKNWLSNGEVMMTKEQENEISALCIERNISAEQDAWITKHISTFTKSKAETVLDGLRKLPAKSVQEEKA